MLLIVALDNPEVWWWSTKFGKLLQFGMVNKVNEIQKNFNEIHSNTPPASILFAIIMGGRETKILFGVALYYMHPTKSILDP